ncbi:hypothetical protein MTO96_019761 [Rhipicephalus appendiculatus]
MKNVVISGLLFLLVRGSVSQGITVKYGSNRPVLATPSVGTAKGAQEDVDYLSVLRGALARGFAIIPASVKWKLFRADVSPECRVGLLRTLRGFLKLEPWTIRLFDSSAIYPTGLLQVSRANMGAFDECLETVVHDKSGNLLTRGQYCNVVAYIKNGTAVKGTVEAMADILHPKLQYFKDYFTVEGATLCRLGVCFIKECGQHDLQALIDSPEPEPWTATQIAITSFLGVLVVLIISATTTDYIIRTSSTENEKSTLIQFVLAFSATSNTRDLLRVADKANADQYAMQFLHGLRFACLVHIVMGHFYTNLSDSWSSFLTIFAISDEWNHMFAAAVFNSVSTFFFLSGFLLCFSTRRGRSNGPVPFLTNVAKRWIRFCAPLFFVIMCLYLFPRFVTGPDAKTGFQKLFDEVTTHWWQLLLQIRNFFEVTVWDVLVHTWYLSADFQLFLIALPTLMLLKGRKMALVAAFSILSLLGCAVGTWVVAHHRLLPFMIFPGPNVTLLSRTQNVYYIRPYYHAVCYFSGCIAFLLVEDFRKRNITKGVQLAGWCVSVSCGLISVFGKLAWYRSPNPTSETVTLFVAFFDRIVWSVFLVWITLACSSGRGGFVGRFLSWNAFVPLSKLSFGVYLIHQPFINLMLHASRERVSWSRFNMVSLWFAVLVWSFLLSYLEFLACEAPVTKLNGLIIFGRIPRRGDARKEKQRGHPA